MILNLTQHKATQDQMVAEVVDLPDGERAKLQELLTFETINDASEDAMQRRAEAIADMAASSGLTYAMIGGAPFFMARLEPALLKHGIAPLYAFSRRVVEEQIQPDGTVRKVNTFKHEGFIPA